jgi:hypothetical protein
MLENKKRILVYPKLHNYDGDVLVYNPIEIILYKDFLELNIDFLFTTKEVFENELTGEEREYDLEEPLWVKSTISRSLMGLDTMIINNIEPEEEKVYKEYTVQIRNLGNLYSFKLKNKSLMLDVYGTLSRWLMGDFDNLNEFYEFGKVQGNS